MYMPTPFLHHYTTPSVLHPLYFTPHLPSLPISSGYYFQWNDYIISGQLHTVNQEAVSRFAEVRRAVGDSCYFRPRVPGSSKLLLVHQTLHQRHIMGLYSQTIIGMDAIYKTNNHGYPFFLVSVETNHGHFYPVAMAVVEDEAGETVAEALQQLRLMNPGWQPQYVIMDKSDAELNAVSEVFPNTTPPLCDFHRLQAWWRWIKKADNGMPPSRKNAVFGWLQQLATTRADFDRQWELFTARDEYQSNAKLQRYLEGGVYAAMFHGGINTTNNMETINRVIK